MDQVPLHLSQGILFFLPFVLLGVLVIFLLPYWFIWKKAGFSPWLSLLMFVPVVNFIMLYVLAFSEWKVVPVSQALPGYYPPSSLPPHS